MSGAAHKPQLPAALRLAGMCVAALVMLALASGLALALLLGIVLLIAGILSWLGPVDVADAWARTLAGIGLIGGSAGLAALAWAVREWPISLLGELARRRPQGADPASERVILRNQRLKFVAGIGILLALMCLPFAAAIHATARGPWLGWGRPSERRIMCPPGNRTPACAVSRPHSSQR